MPAKKNTRKRSRDTTNDSSGPPKKRIKKGNKNVKKTPLRRSVRNKNKNKQKNNTPNESDSESSSDTSETTYVPPIRRSNSNSLNISNSSNKNINSSDKQEYIESPQTNNNNNNNSLINQINSNKIDNTNINKITSEMKNILRNSILLQELHSESTANINKQYNELNKINEKQRNELNENISSINNKYVSAKQLLDTNINNIFTKMENYNNMANNQILLNNNQNQIETEQKYKILYETSIKKVELLNNDIINLQNQLKLLNNLKINSTKQFENKLIEFENNKNKQILQLNNKYSIEINDLKLQLKCINSEFNEYKQNINEKNIINNNNNNVLINSLKRENAMLISELMQYKQNMNTPSQCNSNNTPIPPIDYNNYNKHINNSPLNDRNKNKLMEESNIELIKNKNKNLNEEIEMFKKQLFAKKELIKEFQIILQNFGGKQKDLIKQMKIDKKIINLYQILTCTKIENEIEIINTNENMKEEQYKCRTINKDAMVEYYLKLDVNEKKASFIDYYLINSCNLLKTLVDGLESNMTFYTKDAPLFLKGLIQQLFINKN